VSDISIDGLVSAMVAIGFFAVAALVLLPLAGLAVVRRRRKQKAWTPGVLGFLVSCLVLCVSGGAVLVGVSWLPRRTDDSVLLWGPAVVVMTLAAGFVTWLIAGRRHT